MTLFRPRGQHAPVTSIELFFDLIFVFAITQLSHTLLHHPTLGGAGQVLMLFLAVWWVWIFTTWVTNWLDPARTPIRLMLLVLMLAGLVLSTSVPEAFGHRGLAFALAYVVMQVGRTCFFVWAARRHANAVQARNFLRILAWLCASALFWIAGGLAEGTARIVLWVLALAIEYASPAMRFWVPGLGGSSTRDWDVSGEHMAERCGLFIIIALGESILVTGATLAQQPWEAATLAAFVVAFIGSVAMWWIYFDTGAERGTHRISSDEDPGRLARAAYTYLHMPIVAGIIVMAVGDELVLAHPGGPVSAAAAWTVIGGPALYLLGNLAFKTLVAGRVPLSHGVGLLLLGIVALLAEAMSPLGMAAAVMAALVVTAAWETRSLRRDAPLAPLHHG